jgi:hypothetical protein
MIITLYPLIFWILFDPSSYLLLDEELTQWKEISYVFGAILFTFLIQFLFTTLFLRKISY